jgi:hypothetical protein
MSSPTTQFSSHDAEGTLASNTMACKDPGISDLLETTSRLWLARLGPTRIERMAFVLFCGLVLITYLILGLTRYWPAGTRGGSSTLTLDWPRATSGDEPHYLVVIHSLLYDGDMLMNSDYARITAGGDAGGAFWKGLPFTGHLILVNPVTGQTKTCFNCTEQDAAEIGTTLAEAHHYPSHPVGFPALMAGLCFLTAATPATVEPIVGVWMIIIAWMTVALTYVASRVAGLPPLHAAIAALLLGFCSSWLPYIKSYFPEVPIGLALISAYVAFRRDRMIATAVLLFAAVAMKAPFLVFGAWWGAALLWRQRYRQAFIFGSTLGILGLSLVGFNLLTIRQVSSAGAAPFAIARGTQSLFDTFFDPLHGVIWFIPWVVLALAWGSCRVLPHSPDRYVGLRKEALTDIVIPVWLCIATFGLVAWGPGYCYGPRYWLPLLPFLGLMAGDALVTTACWRRSVYVYFAVWAALVAFVGVSQYHLLFSQRASAGIFSEPVPVR